jgi:hypothetical protein
MAGFGPSEQAVPLYALPHAGVSNEDCRATSKRAEPDQHIAS